MPRAALYKGAQGCLALGYLSEHFRIALQVGKPCLCSHAADVNMAVHVRKYCSAQIAQCRHREAAYDLTWLLCRLQWQ